MAHILIVDDEKSICEILTMMLEQYDHKVKYALTGKEAQALISDNYFDIVITDIRLPDINGLELLKYTKKYFPDVDVIMITAFASTESAVIALKHGASDYLIKPMDLDEVKITVERSIEKRRLISENILLRQTIETKFKLDNIVGNSEEIQKVYELIKKVTHSSSTVLVTGESGTGKELVAKAIHHNSPRKNYPFVAVNCGAMPETLLESELFGYTKGAFTGALTNRKGLIEVADKGTIFLDEITEMSLSMQVKLLRVLQDKMIRPVGGTEETAVDVRIIAATNKDLSDAVKQMKFREDLYYRLNVINIEVPPLRKRIEDISLLSYHFLSRFDEELGKKVLKISKEAMRALEYYHWPGNVRELENAIARAVTLTPDDTILLEYLPDSIRSIETAKLVDEYELNEVFDLEKIIDNYRKFYIIKALQITKGNQKNAASLMKISSRSIRYYIKKYEIQ